MVPTHRAAAQRSGWHGAQRGSVQPNSRGGMQTNNLSLLNITAAIKTPRSHLLSHPLDGGDNGWHCMTRRWLSVRASHRAISHVCETAL